MDSIFVCSIVFYLIGSSISQIQQTFFLTGSMNANQGFHIEKIGEYSPLNQRGNFYQSHCIIQKEELYYFFGRKYDNPTYLRYDSQLCTAQVWKFTINLKQWNCLQNVFVHQKSSLEGPGSRFGSKGWVEEEGSFGFFGGKTFVYQQTVTASKITYYYEYANDIRRYNTTGNSWKQIRGMHSIPDVPYYDGSYSYFTELYEFHQNNTPSGRIGHSITEIGDNQVFLLGGEFYGDWWILDLISYQWKKMGIHSTTKYENGGAPKRSFHSTSKINEEEILIFGGSRLSDVSAPYFSGESEMTSNVIDVYNISSNTFRYVSGQTYYHNGEYNTGGSIPHRENSGMWKINENELLIVAGEGENSNLLRDEWILDLTTMEFTFTGKQTSKSLLNPIPIVSNDKKKYSEFTIFGALKYVSGGYFADKQELIFCGGYGYSTSIQKEV